ncbi:MAG: serine/threonine-protein kinase [Cyanobacteria bacterium P01_A01_bin.135]
MRQPKSDPPSGPSPSQPTSASQEANLGTGETPTKNHSSGTRLQLSTRLTSLSRWFDEGSRFLLKDDSHIGPVRLGYLLALLGATAAASLALGNPWLIQFFERQAQSLLFQVRGQVKPPEDIIIVTIDESSLEQGSFYSADPDRYSALEPLVSWPWQRRVYADVIEKMMAAGAKAVAIDLIFDLPSPWGEADDAALQRALETYSDRVIIASSYEETILDDQIGITQLIEPLPQFRMDDTPEGTINFPLEPDGRIHRLSEAFPILLAEGNPDQREYFRQLARTVPSFDRATLSAAGASPPETWFDIDTVTAKNIHFYGPEKTFPKVPFWTLIDPETWQNHRRDELFKGKIVLIGPTATLFQDFHNTPFGRMSGVEVHANAIASLLELRSPVNLTNPYARGGIVFIVVALAGTGICRFKTPTRRAGATAIAMLIWGSIGFGLFVGAQVIMPIATPIGAIATCGSLYVLISLIRENFNKVQLHSILKQYASSPIVKEIINQQDSLRNLLIEREEEVLGRTLMGRYQLVEVLGAGGFGETYIALDVLRPGNPQCVVKQLRPATDDPKLFALSQRLFTREAETLERLGRHSQIPQLLASFEDAGEFYLVQEFINGHPLRQELPPGKPLLEVKVVEILRDLLEILEFIHYRGVIHRDIKPSNIIRRHTDQRLVLIDFGAVKEIHAQLADDLEQPNTVGIGTRGYMPNEQYAGSPRFSSDIYAVGMIGIQAATGYSPEKLTEDPATGELVWQDKADISPELQAILVKMTRYDFRKRYQSASEAMQHLYGLLKRHAMTVVGMEEGVEGQAEAAGQEDWDESDSIVEAMTLPWQSSPDTE